MEAVIAGLIIHSLYQSGGVPEFAEDCRNERDYITQMDWDDDDKEDLIKIDWGTGKLECYTRSSIRHWMKNDDVKAIEWIENEDTYDNFEPWEHAMGKGYEPFLEKGIVYIKLWPLDNYIRLKDLEAMLNSEETMFELSKEKSVRLGNLQGSFGVSELHGQEPFPPIFRWLSPLVNAIFQNDVETVKQLLKEPNINLKQYDNPLFLASESGYSEIVKELLKHPDIDVNQRSLYTTSLMIASYNGHTDTVRELLKHPDIKVSLKSAYGTTALTYAKIQNHSKIVKLIRAYKRKKLVSKIKKRLR